MRLSLSVRLDRSVPVRSGQRAAGSNQRKKELRFVESGWIALAVARITLSQSTGVTAEYVRFGIPQFAAVASHFDVEC
jgi:hypothetical protein